MGRKAGIASVVFLSGVVALFGAGIPGAQSGKTGAQDTSKPATSPSASAATTSSATPDHAASYYHYMLARRYAELAGIYNRNDYVDKAISEYQQAIQADPDSLFLKVQLARLYWRVSSAAGTAPTKAVAEIQEVLNDNPDDVDAHRLLGRIYVTSLGESPSNPSTSQGGGSGSQKFQSTMEKAIKEYEEVERLDPKDTTSLVLLGRLYSLNRQPDKAEATFKKVMQTDPNSLSAIIHLARIDADHGRFGDAIALLKRIPDNEMDAQLLGLMGYAYSQEGKSADAETTYQKALSMEPENEDIRRAYADALMANGKSDEARTQLETILKSDSRDSGTYLRLARLDRREGHFSEAQKALDSAKTLKSDSTDVAYEQAILYDTIGKDDDAIPVINQWLQRTAKPDAQYTETDANYRAAFLQLLGRIYESQNKYDRAIETFKQIVALGGDQAPSGEGLIADALRLKREPKQALKVLDAAIEKYPHNNSLRLGRARLLGQQGKVEEAIGQLKAMLTGSPTDNEIDLAMADVYMSAKRYPEAETAVKKALALIPDPDDQEGARFMLGSVYEREKKYDLAEEEFKKVLAMDPFNDLAANYLGYEMADRGVQLKESLAYIQKAVKLEPNNGAYLDSLGWVYYKMKRYQEARGPLEKAVHLISDDPTIRMHMGYVYLGLGKKNLAIEQWETALKLWPKAVSSDFGPADAAKLRKELDSVKVEMARKKSAAESN